MWPSNYSWNWNSMDVGPKRDIVGRLRYICICKSSFLGEIRKAFDKEAPEVHFGLYFAHLEWFNPIYLKDKASKFKSQEYVRVRYVYFRDHKFGRPFLRTLVNLKCTKL